MADAPNRDPGEQVANRQTEALAADTTRFARYLADLGLPTDNILASNEGRMNVANNLGDFLATVDPDVKRGARYLSKFVAATAVGLFDAALNYVWNEVVLVLRSKATAYGLDLFFDAAVGGPQREFYSTEEHLSGLKDQGLLDTCLKLELLSSVVYKKLDHILTMRNDVAASHPNVAFIGGYELLGWLQTCVKEVLEDRFSESAIQVTALIHNLKHREDRIDDAALGHLRTELANLSRPHVHNLLIRTFGMYVDPASTPQLRQNIALIAPAIWEHSQSRVKSNIGVKLDSYRTNLEQQKFERGVAFLDCVGGRAFESPTARLVALTHLAERLEQAHDGWDNFWHEPPVMKEILQYCPDAASILEPIASRLIRIVLRCRLGRGVSYCQGVSPNGMPMYDRFLALLDDGQIRIALAHLFSPTINSKLTQSVVKPHLRAVLETLGASAIAPAVRETVEFLLRDIDNAWRAREDPAFRDVTVGVLVWD